MKIKCVCGHEIEYKESYEEWETCPECSTNLRDIQGILVMRTQIENLNRDRSLLSRYIGMIAIDHGGTFRISRKAQMELDINNGQIFEHQDPETMDIVIRYEVKKKDKVNE